MHLAPPPDRRDGAGHLAAFGIAGHDVLHASSRALDNPLVLIVWSFCHRGPKSFLSRENRPGPVAIRSKAIEK
jgi:hypothetical protein